MKLFILLTVCISLAATKPASRDTSLLESLLELIYGKRATREPALWEMTAACYEYDYSRDNCFCIPGNLCEGYDCDKEYNDDKAKHYAGVNEEYGYDAYDLDNDKFTHWCVDRPTPPPAPEPFEKVSAESEGVASNCDNIQCSTEEGGLPACEQLCLDNPECTLFNFCPAGGDCMTTWRSHAVNRCCLRKCQDDDYQLTDTWHGWDVYNRL